MNTQLTLESVQAEFQQWRRNKPRQQSRTPENLKQNAVALLTELPMGRITKALGISGVMLKTWSGLPAQSRYSKSAPEFITLPAELPPETDRNEELTLDVTQPDGSHWRLQGSINTSLLTSFINTLKKLPERAQ